MKYSTNKHGFVSAIIQTMDSRAITTSNIIMDSDITDLRKRVGLFITKQIKKMKPDREMVMWKTSIGEFCIYKESSLDYCCDYQKSKYTHIETKLEFNPIKGDIKKIIIKSKKIINKDYEGFAECNNCFENGLLDYTILRQNNEIKVCKKCKDFDKLLDKISKKIDKEKALQKKGLTQHN